MSRRRYGSLVPLLATALFCLGCGRSASEQTGEPGGAGTGSESSVEGHIAAAIRPGAPQTADAAVRAALDGLSRGDPEAVWDFLPPLVQANVNNLVQEFGRQMDAELWTRAATVTRKLTHLLKTKKDAVLASPFLQGSQTFDTAQLETNWEDLLGLLDVLLESEFSEIESLKTFDGRAFLAGNGSRVIRQLRLLGESAGRNPFVILDDTRVTLVRSDENRATVRLEPPDDEAREIEFMVMERQWVPADMFEWNLALAGIKTELTTALRPEKLASIKAEWLPRLARIEQAVDELQQTETTEDFNVVVAQKLMPYFIQTLTASAGEGPDGESPTSETSQPPADETDTSGNTGALGKVTVIVRRALDEAAEEQVATQLLENVDNPDYGLVAPAIVRNGETELIVSPVGDLGAFAGRIRFGKVVNVDQQARRIIVEWMPPEGTQGAEAGDP